MLSAFRRRFAGAAQRQGRTGSSSVMRRRRTPFSTTAAVPWTPAVLRTISSRKRSCRTRNC